MSGEPVRSDDHEYWLGASGGGYSRPHPSLMEPSLQRWRAQLAQELAFDLHGQQVPRTHAQVSSDTHLRRAMRPSGYSPPFLESSPRTVTEHLQRLYPPLAASNVSASGPRYLVDYGELEYVEPYDRNLDCPICQSPLVKPVKLSCDHVFCCECLDSAMRDLPSRNCPACRQHFRIKDMERAQKLIRTILDDLMVKCPLSSKGCTEIVTRWTVKDHVSIYCDYLEVKCSTESCHRLVQRRHTKTKQCLHSSIKCTLCNLTVTKADYDIHMSLTCPERATCPHCDCRVSLSRLEEHKTACSEARTKCDGATYGCTFSGQLTELEAHSSTCAIKMMGPFLQAQASRLEKHEAALHHLRRQNSVFRASISNIQEMLNPASSNDPTALHDHAVSANHLLLLHESLQREVTQATNKIAELDAKSCTMMLNDRLLHKEEMVHTNAVLSNHRMQIQWLMSNRQPAQQVQGTDRALQQASQNNARRGAVVQATAEAGPSSANGAGNAMFNPFTSNRQDPKL